MSDDEKHLGDETLRKRVELGNLASGELTRRGRIRERDQALKLVGKCYRKGDFTGETAHWRQFAIVTGVDDNGCLTAFAFDFFGDYSFNVSYEHSPYFRDSSDCGSQWEECPRTELLAGWEKAMAMLTQKANAALGRR